MHIIAPSVQSLHRNEMREVEQDSRSKTYDEPKMQGLLIRDLRYADDIALLSTTSKGLENLIMSVKEHSEQKGLNIKKTKIMDTDKCKEDAFIEVNGEEIERVTSFEYLGARIEANGKTTHKKKTSNGNIQIEKDD